MLGRLGTCLMVFVFVVAAVGVALAGVFSDLFVVLVFSAVGLVSILPSLGTGGFVLPVATVLPTVLPARVLALLLNVAPALAPWLTLGLLLTLEGLMISFFLSLELVLVFSSSRSGINTASKLLVSTSFG